MSAFIVHPTPLVAAPAPDPEGILAATQQLETALSVGREQVRKIREDFTGAQTRFLRSQQEAERKIRDVQSREQQLSQSFEAHKLESTRRERVMTAEFSAQRGRAEALQRDLDNALKQLEHERRENARKTETASQREEALKIENLSVQTARESLRTEITQLRARATQLRDALDKSNGEIELYKSSWARVLKMEQDARAHLQKKSDAETRIRALENRNIELLAEAKRRIRGLEAAQRTLQNQLVKAQKEAANAECALRAAEESRTRIEQLERAAAVSSSVPTGTPADKNSAEAPEIDIEIIALDDEFQRISSSRTHLEGERNALKAQLSQALQQLDDSPRMNTEEYASAEPVRND
jgi:chromosome segregation ATPase